jgi:antitoxin VapB
MDNPLLAIQPSAILLYNFLKWRTVMALSIRNRDADRLARRLAEIDKISVTKAVVTALEEAIKTRLAAETPRETARRILEKHGLTFPKDRKPVPPEAFHDLDHDLAG